MAATVVHLTDTLAAGNNRLFVLDERGQPLTGRVPVVLERLAPTFARQFDEFRDEAVLADALERAAHLIRRREARGGVRNLEAYAWVTLVRIANCFRRSGRGRLACRTTSESSESDLNLAVATVGSPEQLERAILIRELLGLLAPRERVVLELRLEGLTTQEIAEALGSTTGAVDVLVNRAHHRLRLRLNPARSVKQSGRAESRRSTKVRRRTRGRVKMPGSLLSKVVDASRGLEL
jgi:RNA polymerase sigma factor (sigma-70 family)